MNKPDSKILNQIKSKFDEIILDESVVYLSSELIQSGKYIFGDASIVVPWKAFIAFIDLVPRANWGHNCCYLAFQAEGNEIIQIKAQFSPFYSSNKLKFNLLSKGSSVPDWCVTTNC